MYCFLPIYMYPGTWKNSEPFLLVEALKLGKIPKETWEQVSKDMKHNLHFSGWLINRKDREIKQEEGARERVMFQKTFLLAMNMCVS